MGSRGLGFLLLSRLFVNLNARNENYEAVLGPPVYLYVD